MTLVILGTILLEGNFKNNTSMVFGQCLRSLLEHQKNQTKPLQKHYQYSLLTRYMREYLGGKKRMMLILTVKPGLEDYLNTSFMLRQASPFTKIKFKSLVEPVYLTCIKRPNQAFLRAEQLKKMKINSDEAYLGGKIENCHLRDCLTKEQTRNLDLQNELARERMRLSHIENEVKQLKSHYMCHKKACTGHKFSVSLNYACSSSSKCQTTSSSKGF